jgi:hypothetical protein
LSASIQTAEKRFVACNARIKDAFFCDSYIAECGLVDNLSMSLTRFNDQMGLGLPHPSERSAFDRLFNRFLVKGAREAIGSTKEAEIRALLSEGRVSEGMNVLREALQGAQTHGRSEFLTDPDLFVLEDWASEL